MKTISLKKVAVVAVASLGFGLLSVVPAKAETLALTFNIMSSSASAIDSATAKTSTLTYTVADLTLTSGAADFAATDVGRYIYSNEYGQLGPITAFTSANAVVLGAAPTATTSGTITAMANSNAVAVWFLGSKASTTVGDGITATTIKGMTVTAGKIAGLNLKYNAAADATDSRTRITIGGTVIGSSQATIIGDTNTLLPFTAPTTAGTYEAVVQYAIGGVFSAITTVSKSFTLTVAAASAYNAGASSSFANDLVAAATADTDGTIYGPSTLDTQAGNITVTVKKGDGTACTACSVGAYMIGQGNVSAGQSVANATAAAKARVVATGATPAADGTANIAVWGDGTAGTGTVYVRVTDIDGLTITTLTTHKVVFYGAVTKLEVSKQPYSILKAGGATSGIKTALVSAATTTILTSPAIVIKATDSAGNAVGGLTLTCVPTDISVVGSCSNNEDVVTTIDPNSTWGGPGYYVFDMTSAQSAVSKAKSTVTYRVVNPAAPTTYLTVTADFTIGGTVAKETISFDKTAYAPGEAMVVTRTAVDSAGNPVFDGAAAPSITFSKAVGGSVGTSNYVGGKKATSLASPSVFAPTIAGAFTALATSGNTAGDTITASSSVTDANAGLMTQIDALNAKIVALNALIAKIMKKLGVK